MEVIKRSGEVVEFDPDKIYQAVLNYMGFEAGPTRLPLVPAPAEEAKRIIKVVVDGDYHATKEIITGVLRPDY